MNYCSECDGELTKCEQCGMNTWCERCRRCGLEIMDESLERLRELMTRQITIGMDLSWDIPLRPHAHGDYDDDEAGGTR